MPLKISRLGLSLTLTGLALLFVACAAGQAENEASPPPAQEEAQAEGTYKGTPVGFTAEGYPFRGSPDAPLTVYEYSDYECPFCARHVVQTEPALLDGFVESGQAKFVFRDMPLSSLHPNAFPAAIAANCVAEQDIVLFWEMHDLIFRTQKEWAPMETALAFFADLAEEVGADATAYGACVANNAEQLAKVNASLEEAQSYGFTGTPSFRFVRESSGQEFTLVGAQPYDVFAEWIETIAAGGSPADPAQAQRPQQQSDTQMPFWATAEGLTPDPDRPGFTVAGDEFYGSPDAPLVVVEFSDFQCPFCRRHTLNTQPVLDAGFIEPGDVMWVFKHFPVQSTHPYAFSAGIAAECAARQEAFWDFHHRLFEEMEEWTRPENSDYFIGLAGEMGLDTDAFATCLTEDEPAQAVQSDLQEGSAFVRGTPTFVVLYNGQGRLIPGALPADQFVGALTQMLAEATNAPESGDAGDGG